jgi:predicted transcriptional regulator
MGLPVKVLGAVAVAAEGGIVQPSQGDLLHRLLQHIASQQQASQLQHLLQGLFQLRQRQLAQQDRVKAVLTVEMSLGQMVDDVRLAVSEKKPVEFYGRCGGVVKRYEIQQEQPMIPSDIHVVRIGNIAFATNRFELYMDYMHRIQARSPFEQTFIVQLVTGPNGCGSYLATVRGEENKGYSASPYCNQVSPAGGQQLVEETLKVLKEIR